MEELKMYHFEFVSKKKRAPIKKKLIALINEVQDIVRKDFTFRYDFVGSDKRNMVTCDFKSNIGFDFDVNIEINDEDNSFSAKEIKLKLMNALNKMARKYGYDFAEDSTRVITIKVKDRENSKILHSCDFAIVNNYVDDDGYNRQEYIRFNKKHKSYSWEEQPNGYYMLPEKADWIQENEYIPELRQIYLDKKNRNTLHKRSRTLYAEAVHEICQIYGFYD